MERERWSDVGVRDEADDFVLAKGLNEGERMTPTRIDTMIKGREADEAVNKQNTHTHTCLLYTSRCV